MKYERIVSEFLGEVWAILPEQLEIITSLVALRAAGERLTTEEISARIGGREASREPRRSGGVAVLPVYGVINHRMSAMSDMSGGTSIEKLTAQFRDAMNDPNISSIVLDVDSPGGSVSGVPELASEIYDARRSKRIVAQVNPTAASAANWLASSAGEIAITPSGSMGSIGVFAAHEDLSRMLDQKGVKVSLVSAGKYKTEANQFQPLSDEARAYMQSRVDEYHGMFVDAVARGRGVRPSEVRDGMGQGRMMSARNAVAAGMADRVATLDETVQRLLGAGSSGGSGYSFRGAVDIETATETGAEAGATGPRKDTKRVDGKDCTKECFAYRPDDNHDNWKLPIECPDHDRAWEEKHVRLAVQLFDATDMPDKDEKAKARTRVAAAARKYKIGDEKDEKKSEATIDLWMLGLVAYDADSQSFTTPATAENEKEVAMSTTITPAAAAAETALAAESTRQQTIIRMANQTGIPLEKAKAWIAANVSVEQAMTEMLAELTAKAKALPQPGAQVTLSDAENSRYSMIRGIRALCGRMGAKGYEASGFEMEISDAIAKKLGRETTGFYVPTNIRNVRREFLSDAVRERFEATLTGGSGTGENLVQTTIMPQEFIELLRNLQVCMRLGARRLSDLQGNIALPKQSGAGTFYWTGENPSSPVTEADQAFAQVTGTPHQGMAQTAYSRQFLIQSSLDAEAIIREDLAMINAIALDEAALVGTGSSNQPKGIANQTGVNVEYTGAGGAGGNGGAITYEAITKAQRDIEVANVPLVGLGCAYTPETKQNLRNTPELSNTIALPVWHADNTTGGWPAMASNQLPKNGTLGTGTNLHMAILGSWLHLIFAEWGAMEIIADPFTQAGKGNVVLTSSVLVDILVRYAAAFAVIPDIAIQ